MWMQFFIEGSEVDSEVIGDSGTTDAEQFGNYTSPVFCTDGATEAEISITNQNWAAGETNTFSNVTILCWEGFPDIITNDPICGNDDLDLEGTAGDESIVDTWEWTNNGASSIDDPSSQITFATGPEDGEEYTLTATDENNCSGTTSVTVTITEVPEIFPAGPLEVCDIDNDGDETFDLTTLNNDISGGTGNVLWFEDDMLTTPISNPDDFFSTPTTVYAIVEDNGCQSVPEAVDLELLENPEPIATSNFIDFCVGEGQDLELDEVGDFGDSWEWSGPDGFSSTEQDPTVIITSTSQSGTYIVTATDVSGMCTGTSEITINVGNTPAADATASATDVCANSNVDLFENGGDGVSWNWSGPDGFSSTAQNPTINNITSAGAGDYIVTVTDATGCTNTAEVAITVGTLMAGISGGADLCPNQCTDEDSDLEFILSGGTEPYTVSVNVNGIPIPGFAINIDETVRICHDEDLVIPGVDLGADPIILSLPTSFLPVSLELVSVVDDAGCSAMIDPANNTIDLSLLDMPVINIPMPDPFCIDDTETVDLTSMDNEITGGDSSVDVLWFNDMDGENLIGDPSSYDPNDGVPVYAAVDDGNCWSDIIEISFEFNNTPIITVNEEITGCSMPFELPDPEDIADIEYINNPVYFLDMDMTDGPYNAGSFIDPTNITSIFIADANGPCNAIAEVVFNVNVPPVIIEPTGQLGGCGSIVLPFPDIEGDFESFEYNTEMDGVGDSYVDGDEIFVGDGIDIIYLLVFGENDCNAVEEIEILLDNSITYSAAINPVNCGDVILPGITPTTSEVSYYTGSNGTGSTFNPGDTLFADPDNSLSYTLYIYDPTQDPLCAAEVEISFTIDVTPQLIAPLDTFGCGDFIVPVIQGMPTGQVQMYGVDYNDPANAINPGQIISTDQTIYILDTIGNCTFIDSFDVTILDEPDTGSPGQIDICQGYNISTFDLMSEIGNPDQGGTWAYPQEPDFNPLDSTLIDLSPLAEGSYLFQYAIEDSCGLFVTSLNVDVVSSFNSGTDSILMLCPGDPPQQFMELLSNPSTGGEWMQVAGPSNIDLSDSTQVSFSGAESGSYAFTYTIGASFSPQFCNASASSLIIELAEGPEAGDDINTSACVGDIINMLDLISMDADTDGTFEPMGFLIAGNNWNTTGNTPDQNYTINYIVPSSFPECPNDTAVIEIYLTDQISAGNPTLVNQVCEGDTIQLSNYIENASPGGVFSMNSAPQQIIPDSWIADATTTFEYLVEGSGSCPSDSLAFDIVVNLLPTAEYTISDVLLCGSTSNCFNIQFTSNGFMVLDLELQNMGSGETWPFNIAYDMVGELTVCSYGPTGTESNDTLYIGSDGNQFELIPVQVMNVVSYCTQDNPTGSPIMIEVFESYDIEENVELCERESIIIDNTEYSNSEDIMLQTINGCDSLIRLNITHLENGEGLIEGIYCEGDEIDILGTIINSNTTDMFVFMDQAANGCDSIVNVDISFESQVTGNFNTTLCPGETITVENVVFDENNTSDDILIPNGSVNGCDSIVAVNVAFFNEEIHYINQTICEGESIQVGTDIYDANNIGGMTVLANASQNGCDSIVEVGLIVLLSNTGIVDDVYCEETDVIINGVTYNSFNTTGTEILVGGAVNGCDSIVEINLSFELPSAQIQSTSICPESTTSTVSVDSIQGLGFPIEVFVDGTFYDNFIAEPVLLELGQGSHTIELTNAGCVYSEDIILNIIDSTGLSLVVNNTGTNSYQLSLVGSEFSDINWSASAELSCYDCSTTNIVINQNTSVSVMALYGNNCLYENEIDLQYTPVIEYYIPNIIDINNPSNDRFYIGSNFDDAVVLEMYIYDRWGNLMHAVDNLPVNDPDLGWNGYRNDQPVEQGVYVYLVKVLNTEGREEIRTGNLTVVR